MQIFYLQSIICMAFYLISFFILFLYTVIIIYYRQSWCGIKNYTAGEVAQGEKIFISIIIAARNEEKAIGSCLSSIKSQTYPTGAFEIILVDDHSADATVAIAQSLKIENLKIIQLKDLTGESKLNSYKKKAIESAIDIAKGDLIITTDADCIVPQAWLETYASFYMQKKPVFIAAPVVYADYFSADSFFTKLLKIFQSLDFMTLQGITGASVSKGFHNMCNGANLAYTKEVFLAVNGFEGIDTIASGDDMLLMDKIQKIHPDKIQFLKSANAIVETQPATSLKEFMNQRIRWASKADKYTDRKITFVLLLVYIFNAWMFITAIASFFSHSSFYVSLVMLIVKTSVELFFLYPVAKFFNKQKLLWWFIPAQPFHIIYTIVAGWLGKFGSYTWKGRVVK